VSGELSVVFEPANEAAKLFVTDGIANYNIATTGLAAYYPVGYFLRSKDDEILGGLHGAIWGKWLYIKIFWIAEPARGKGYGRQMLSRAEAYAVERDCIGAHLETFSFQARPLYEKLGYAVFGEIRDYPPGHTFYFMKKRFATEAG
jgi:GNAT superfamily N-acetyltransferase